MAVKPVVDAKLSEGIGRDELPAILAGFGEREAGMDGFDVPGVFAHHVRSGSPDGQEEFDLELGFRPAKNGFDFEIVGFGGGDPEGIANGHRHMEVAEKIGGGGFQPPGRIASGR